MDSLEAYPFVWEMVYYPFVVAMLFINCFADKEPLYMEGEGKSEVICLVFCPFHPTFDLMLSFPPIEPMSRRRLFISECYYVLLVGYIGMERV